MKQIRAYKTSLEEVLNALPADSASSHFIIPVKATVLAFNSGTLIQDVSGGYSLAVPGEWFRFNCNILPQVDAFDQLNAVGLTVLKKDIMKQIFNKENSSGQKDGAEGNTGDEKAQPSVEANPRRKKKSEDRT